MTTWRAASATNVGLVREANEDALLVTPTMAIVADGMGGHAAGEVASELAVSVFARLLAEQPSLARLNEGLLEANAAILADAQAHPDRTGMGTTLTAVMGVEYDTGTALAWVNIGDSRLYQLRDGAIKQITDDHSVAEEWVRQGRLSKEEAAVHPRRHQLTRVLGMEEAKDGDTGLLSVQVGDRLLLCSDGLSNEVSDAELAELASAPHGLEQAVDALVARALANGGHDNITVVVLEVESVSVEVPEQFRTEAPLSRATFAPASAPSQAAPVIRRSQRRRPWWMTWRSGAFLAALGGLVAGVFMVLSWYAHSAFYLADYQGSVTVYQGQPHGFLWYEPKVALQTVFKSSELLPGDAKRLKNYISEPSLAAAIRHASNMHTSWVVSSPTPAQ